jgi:hypothetical protein
VIRRSLFSVLMTLVALLVVGACDRGSDPAVPTTAAAVAEAEPSGDPTTTSTTVPEEEREPENEWVTRRPSWLGTRVLPKRPDGFGEIRPTPKILRNRRLATIDLFPQPKSNEFHASIGPLPPAVVKRSSYRPKCPVTLDQLSYIKMTFWGFDHEPHVGEMIIHASVAEDIVGVFKKLYRARFPIEEMRIVHHREIDAPPTGDTDVTSSFECREVTLGSTWSQHSYGLAVDIGPFHNPYVRDDLVAPELASAYKNRDWIRPGMIVEGDVVTRAFDAIGWQWGGRWNTLKDYMHFSQNGH